MNDDKKENEFDFDFDFDFDSFNFSGESLSEQEIVDLRRLEDQAADGDPAAQYRFACSCLHDRSKFNDEVQNELKKKAYTYGKLAADQGHRLAQALVGYCYSIGTGIEQSDELAFRYYLLSAKNGYAVAECVLANFYLTGKYVDKNPPQALHWYVKAARHGSPDAMIKLAEFHQDGAGGKTRSARAFRWWLRAARLGATTAKLAVADAYFYGIGIPRDYDLFLFWVKSAAADNNYQAENMLEYANQFIEVNRWEMKGVGWPFEVSSLRFRRSTVVRMNERETLPVKEMIRDVEVRMSNDAPHREEYHRKMLSRMKNLEHAQDSRNATRH